MPFVDAGYRGVDKREKAQGPTWHVACSLANASNSTPSASGRGGWRRRRTSRQVRATVEHPLHAIQNPYRQKKPSYKGLGKNEGQLFSLFGLANLVIAKKPLLALHARDAS